MQCDHRAKQTDSLMLGRGAGPRRSQRPVQPTALHPHRCTLIAQHCFVCMCVCADILLLDGLEVGGVLCDLKKRAAQRQNGAR